MGGAAFETTLELRASRGRPMIRFEPDAYDQLRRDRPAAPPFAFRLRSMNGTGT